MPPIKRSPEAATRRTCARAPSLKVDSFDNLSPFRCDCVPSMTRKFIYFARACSDNVTVFLISLLTLNQQTCMLSLEQILTT